VSISEESKEDAFDRPPTTREIEISCRIDMELSKETGTSYQAPFAKRETTVEEDK
jgi:hypothetical protein